MSILTGDAIRIEVEHGRIVIDPFDPKRLGPNSYDLTLDRWLAVYAFGNSQCLDSREENPLNHFPIPEEGLVLSPGNFYLGSTMERAGSDHYVPMLEGRSSAARLGISVHLSAGVGDIGWKCPWTMEITVAVPVKVYPRMSLCQVMFYAPAGRITSRYTGKYVGQSGPVGSCMWKDRP